MDGGTYTCTATNRLGYIEAVGTLLVRSEWSHCLLHGCVPVCVYMMFLGEYKVLKFWGRRTYSAIKRNYNNNKLEAKLPHKSCSLSGLNKLMQTRWTQRWKLSFIVKIWRPITWSFKNFLWQNLVVSFGIYTRFQGQFFLMSFKDFFGRNLSVSCRIHPLSCYS